METSEIQVGKPCEITALDIDRAYRFSGLRKEGVGLVKAIETPVLYKSLCNTAKAMKRKQHAAAAPIKEEIC